MLRSTLFAIPLLFLCYHVIFAKTLDLAFIGINFKSLDNFAPSNTIRTTKTGDSILCWAACALDERCQAIFVHSVDNVCLLLDGKYNSSNGLQNYRGMKYFSLLPTQCADVPFLEFSGTSTMIQIDPDGRSEEFEPVNVWCDLQAIPGKAVTVLHHNFEEKSLIDGFEPCGSYRINLTYALGLEMVKRIVDLSTGCKQNIIWECLGAESYMRRKPCAWWTNRNMTQSHYFIGSGNSTRYCECGQTCPFWTGCYCSDDKLERFIDEGFVTNKNALPITGIFAGDTGMKGSFDEMAWHTIGPVLCW